MTLFLTLYKPTRRDELQCIWSHRRGHIYKTAYACGTKLAIQLSLGLPVDCAHAWLFLSPTYIAVYRRHTVCFSMEGITHQQWITNQWHYWYQWSLFQIKCDNTLGFHKLFLHHDIDSESFLFSNFAFMNLLYYYYYNIKPGQPVSYY